MLISELYLDGIDPDIGGSSDSFFNRQFFSFKSDKSSLAFLHFDLAFLNLFVRRHIETPCLPNWDFIILTDACHIKIRDGRRFFDRLRVHCDVKVRGQRLAGDVVLTFEAELNFLHANKLYVGAGNLHFLSRLVKGSEFLRQWIIHIFLICLPKSFIYHFRANLLCLRIINQRWRKNERRETNKHLARV